MNVDVRGKNGFVVTEAIHKLQMTDHIFYIFTYSDTNQISIAYLKNDGNY